MKSIKTVLVSIEWITSFHITLRSGVLTPLRHAIEAIRDDSHVDNKDDDVMAPYRMGGIDWYQQMTISSGELFSLTINFDVAAKTSFADGISLAMDVNLLLNDESYFRLNQLKMMEH